MSFHRIPVIIHTLGAFYRFLQMKAEKDHNDVGSTVVQWAGQWGFVVSRLTGSCLRLQSQSIWIVVRHIYPRKLRAMDVLFMKQDAQDTGHRTHLTCYAARSIYIIAIWHAGDDCESHKSGVMIVTVAWSGCGSVRITSTTDKAIRTS